MRLPHAPMVIRLPGGQGDRGARPLGHLEEDERADQGGLDLAPRQPEVFLLYVSRLLDLHLLVFVMHLVLNLELVLILVVVLVLQPTSTYICRIACPPSQ